MNIPYVNTLTRHHFNTLLFLFISLASYAQTDSVLYFDNYDRSATIKGAAYYRKLSKPDTGNIYSVVEYWTDGHVKMTGYSLDAAFLYKIGRFAYYYRNGIKSGEGQYYSDFNQHVFGFKNKKWQTWYTNGKPKEEWVYKIADDFAYSEGFLISFWDTSGNQLTIKGAGRYYYTDLINTKDSLQHISFTGPIVNGLFDGMWKGYYPNGKVYAEEVYKQDKLVNGKSYDGAGNAFNYDSLQTAASFPGGEAELNKFIKLNIQPPAGMGNDILQSVTLRAFIGRNGFIGNVGILHGVNSTMNSEAVRVAKALPRFIPATYRGQPVDSYYTFSVSFNQL